MSSNSKRWTAASYHNNVIWTQLEWSNTGKNPISAAWIVGKFNKAMSALDANSRWEILIDSDGGPHGLMEYRTRFASESEEEHGKVIRSVMDMHKKDRMSFSDFFVVDSRFCVIGPSYPQGMMPPKIFMTELIGGGSICGSPLLTGDQLCEGIVRWTRFTIVDTVHGKDQMHRVALCKKRESDDDWLHYIIGEANDSTLSVMPSSVSDTGIPFAQKLVTIRKIHNKWFVSRGQSMDRLTYEVQRKTYSDDTLLSNSQRKWLIDRIDDKFSIVERSVYLLLGDPSHEWKMMPIKLRIKSIHDEHEEWLGNQGNINHRQHRVLVNAYKSDRFMIKSKIEWMVWMATDKFMALIQQIDLIEDYTLFNREAYRYWVNLKPREKLTL